MVVVYVVWLLLGIFECGVVFCLVVVMVDVVVVLVVQFFRI